MPGTDGRNALLSGPGLNMEVVEAGIDAATRVPYAVLRFTDADDRPLDRTGVFTQGAVDARFTVAHLPVEMRAGAPDVVLPWASYLEATVMSADGTRTGMQPQADSTGTWTDVDAADGRYRYDFTNPLPTDYDTAETHRIAIYATRTFDGVRYVANEESDFRPDGAAITVTRSIVSNEGCNVCHSPISAHGGSREDVDLCVTCHTAGATDPDTGESIEFRSMVHRIHRGANLPSVQGGVPFEIIGFRGSVNDYSDVHFPKDLRNCQVCHLGPDGDRWNTVPSRAACGSCHDDIWFEAGAPPESWMRLHPGGDRPDDTQCVVCHESAGSISPIIDNHFTKRQLPIASTIEVNVASATINASRQIEVDFTVLVDGAGRDLGTAPLTSLSAVVAGPTTDYLFNASFNFTSASAGTLTPVDASAGHFMWTSAATVDTIAANAAADPERTAPGIDASGTWAIGIQASLRKNGDATMISCTGTSTATCPSPAPLAGRWGCVSGFCTEQYDYYADNPVVYVAITDTTPVPRREVVSIDNCNNCHEHLEIHGGSRNNPEFCVMCHNSTFDTIDRMPVPTGTEVVTNSLSFANFVHRIHTGEHGVSDARFWSPRPSGGPINAGGNETDFAEVRYPADRRVCTKCHTDTDTAYDLDVLIGLRSPRRRLIDDTRSVIDTYFYGPTASACNGCHDSPGAIAHAETMTTAMGEEGCTACHGAGNAFGVDVAHARPTYDIRMP